MPPHRKVPEALCFRVVRPSGCPSVRPDFRPDLCPDFFVYRDNNNNNNNNYIYRALNTGVSKRTGGLSNWVSFIYTCV